MRAALLCEAPSPSPCGLRSLVLLALALLAAMPLDALPAWAAPQPILYSSLGGWVEASGTGTYARVPHTVLNGTVIKAGAQNLQSTIDSCAASCSGSSASCNGFLFCSQGPCLFSQGEVAPGGACQLMYLPNLEAGPGPLSLATSDPALSDAGVKLLIERPTSTYPGYSLLFAQGLKPTYILQCNDSLTNLGCLLIAPVQAMLDRCSAWPECQAVAVAPGAFGTNASVPVVILAGLGTGQPLNLSDTLLNTVLYTLVRQNWQPSGGDSSGGEEAGSGLSASAIAGIAVGGTASIAALALGAWLLMRHRRQQALVAAVAASQGADAKPPGGPLGVARAGSKPDDLAEVWSKLEGGDLASNAAKTVAEMFSEAQLAEVIIPSKSLTIAYKGGIPYRLGRGASGEVYLARLNGVTNVAVKMFGFDNSINQPRHFIEEAVTLRKLLHPHLIQFLGLSLTTAHASGQGDEERGLLVMELAAGDLWSALEADQSKGEGSFSWYKRGQKVALQVASALLYLHDQRILHMDLKPQNVLLMRDGTAKVADVGFSRALNVNRSFVSCTGRFGTFNWCAPEILAGAKATKGADVYSYGVILWQLCSGREPERGDMELLRAPEQCPAEVAELQARCCSPDPTLRPTAEEIVRVLSCSGNRGSTSMRRPAANRKPAAASASSGGSQVDSPTTVWPSQLSSGEGPSGGTKSTLAGGGGGLGTEAGGSNEQQTLSGGGSNEGNGGGLGGSTSPLWSVAMHGGDPVKSPFA